MGEFTIEITPSLIDQLLDDGQKSKRRTRRTKTKAPQRPQPEIDQKQISDDTGKEKGATGAAWPVQHPLFLPVPPPVSSTTSELDAIRSVVQESEMVVEKLRKQEESMVQEVTQKAKDLHEKEFKIPEPKPMPCLGENDALKSCYRENNNDLMKCAHLAKHFADCARRVRQLVSSVDK